MYMTQKPYIYDLYLPLYVRCLRLIVWIYYIIEFIQLSHTLDIRTYVEIGSIHIVKI